MNKTLALLNTIQGAAQLTKNRQLRRNVARNVKRLTKVLTRHNQCLKMERLIKATMK